MYLIDKFRFKMSAGKFEKTTPTNHKADDIFFVSFPKSGNTWLRFLIANSIKEKFCIEQSINWFTIHDFIPDIHISRSVRSENKLARCNFPRIIKSHSDYNPFYFRVILLVRHPVDVMGSYYNYLTDKGDISKQITFRDFILTKKYGAAKWQKHTNSWINALSYNKSVNIFYYENFLKNPVSELETLTKVLGLEMSQVQLDRVVERCSKNNMSALELNTRPTVSKHQFVDTKNSDHKDKIDREDKLLIRNICGDTCKKIGYSE